MTNSEVFARKLMDKALDGDKIAMEMVADRVEGKAVRAAQVSPADKMVEDQLDLLDKEQLDSFAKGEVKDSDDA